MTPGDRPRTPVEPGAEPRDTAEVPPPRYASFVLRCRQTADGRIVAHLSEVGSDLRCTLTDLEALPAILRRWLAGEGGPGA